MFPICCQHCRAEIVACDGLYGDWMHAATRREHCHPHGTHLAAPETPRQAQPGCYRYTPKEHA